jgi:toxin ParE1/3/4
MKTLRIRPEAELDMFEAALWYEGERPELGATFLQAVRYVFGRIEKGALQFPLVSADIRRAILPRFPFGVFFVVEGDISTVLAVTHLHRHPASWERRR